jgi:hypothetical protein
MHLLQITVGPNATPIIPKAVVPANSAAFSVLYLQNNSGTSVRVGDSTVTASKGILLASGTPGGSLTITPSLQYSGDLTEFYLFGAGAIIDIMVFD